MALTLEELQALTNASLVQLFKEHRDVLHQMAQRAYDYTRQYIEEPNSVRVDDVIMTLAPALAVTDLLTDYLAEHKLRQKYWIRYFGDYVLDQFWPGIQRIAERKET